MSSLYDANLSTLETRSPDTALAVRASAGGDAYTTASAASGDRVIVSSGRALDSRRDPRGTARDQAAACRAARVVLLGLGTGYLAEALVERGVEVAAIVVDRAASLRAAMQARDLRGVLAHAPVVALDALTDPVALATLRARADTLTVHGPSVNQSDDLRALAEGWSAIPVADRPPRVIVVGPVTGGSLGIARSVGAALERSGADVTFVDATAFDEAYRALGSRDASAAASRARQGQLVELVGEWVADVAIGSGADLVLALAQAPLHRAALDRMREAGIPTAFWFVENCRVLTYWREMAAAYDWFYAIQPGAFLERLADAGAPSPRYLPLACDPRRHAPVPLTPADTRRFGGPVTFAGSPYLNRRHIFSGLADLGLRLWGPGWSDTALAGCVAGGGRRFSTDDMMRVFSASRINLNVHSAAHVAGLDPDPDYVNPRTFELASCGAFQLVDRRDPLAELFADDEVIAFSSLSELRRQIVGYLDDEDARAEIAARARARAHRDHTFEHRMSRVLRDTVAPELVAAAALGRRHEPIDDAIARHEGSPVPGREELLLRVVREIGRSRMAS